MSTPKSPYRNDVAALRERQENLRREIDEVRRHTEQLESLKAREAELARELAAVEGRLHAGGAPKRPLPMLDQVRVASPCKASWDEMLGDDRVRFCLSCEKNVYNLSSMPREEAEALLAERLGGEVCVRFYQRADGTILTQDCPVGVTKKRRKKAAMALAGAGALAFAAAAGLKELAAPCPVAVQGAVAPEYTESSHPLMGAPTLAPPTPTVGKATADEPAPSKAAPPKATPKDEASRHVVMGRMASPRTHKTPAR